ncbi:MAG: hypothetical protein INR69_02445 [Mucilaginibacter polytrichastri]|nr:hypothetical protein [Mucilaginibacter polytrichastri]
MKNIYKTLLAVVFALIGFSTVAYGYFSTDGLLSTTLLIIGNVMIILAVDIAFSFLAKRISKI